MNTVITIGRQYGSRGREIGKCLARRLGVPFYDRERLREEAVDSGLEAVLETYGEKHAASLLLSLATGAYSFGYNDAAHQSAISQKAYLLAFDMIHRVARQGPCVIVGRCADYVLEDHPGRLSVFIHAPLEIRTETVADRLSVSNTEARQKIQKTDRLRQNYYNYYTQKRWGEVDGYHLCIDSSALGAEGTAAALEQMLSAHAAPKETEKVIHLEERRASGGFT